MGHPIVYNNVVKRSTRIKLKRLTYRRYDMSGIPSSVTEYLIVVNMYRMATSAHRVLCLYGFRPSQVLDTRPPRPAKRQVRCLVNKG